MKIANLLFVACVMFLLPTFSQAYTADDFVTTWQTNSSDQIIIPTTGSGYNFTVDWGDGSTSTHTGAPGLVSHTYTTPGVKEVVITPNVVGGFPRILFANHHKRCLGTSIDATTLLTIEQWGTNQWSSMQNAFCRATNLRIPATDAPNLSAVVDMRGMFYEATSFNDPIDHWDVSHVQHMGPSQLFAEGYGLFQGATSFNQPLNNWDMSSVTVARAMFLGATSFNQPLNNWDMSSVTVVEGMFALALSFNQDISTWDVSSVQVFGCGSIGVSCGYGMFASATAFNQDLSSWDVSQGTIMDNMFNYSGLSKENYSNIITAWSALPSLQNNVTLGATNITYLATASTARQSLIDSHNWTINDAGLYQTHNLAYTIKEVIYDATSSDYIILGTSTKANINQVQSESIYPDEILDLNISLDCGYKFAVWQDNYSTDNPREVSNIFNDTEFVAYIEIDTEANCEVESEEESNTSESTATSIRSKQFNDLITTPAIVTVATITSFTNSVRDFLSYLEEKEDDLINLSPEESKSLIISLRDILIFLLKLLPNT
jgi:hypothetical protein